MSASRFFWYLTSTINWSSFHELSEISNMTQCRNHNHWLISETYLSQESAINFTFLLLNSFSNSMTFASSLVQTGVKSPGCVKRIAQQSSIHLWNEIGPLVVSAQKSGNTAPRIGIFLVKGNGFFGLRFFCSGLFCLFSFNEIQLGGSRRKEIAQHRLHSLSFVKKQRKTVERKEITHWDLNYLRLSQNYHNVNEL